MKLQYILSLALIVIAFAAGIYFYEELPDLMPSHWNAAGEVDDYMEKDAALLFMPAITLFLLGLFILIPKLDPLKKNIEKFRKYYDWFMLLMIAFFIYIYFVTIAWALGYQFSMNYAIMPPLAALFYYIGILCENSKRNWFIGIRTPWTLSSDTVWNKTHRLAGKLYKILAVVFIIGLLIPHEFFIYMMGLVIIIALYPVVYSFFEFQKLTGK